MSHQIAHVFDSVPRTNDVKSVEKIDFSAMLLPDTILKGLNSSGFKYPSPIQLSALPLARCGLDLVVQAKSGTGKTLVFALTALEAVQVSIRKLQVIILAPTREIGLQIADVISSVGCGIRGLHVGTFIGGTSVSYDKKKAKGCHIAVGAPGRIRHLIDLQEMDASAVRLFVLDEADKLMDETFIDDINYIFWKTAESKQVLACSATYTNELVGFLSNYMRSGRHVTPDGNPTPVLLGLKQFVKTTSDHPNSVARFHFKQKALLSLLSSVQFDQCLIFSNYQTRAESLCLHLQSLGWASVWMAGKQEQGLRIDALNQLKEHKARVLVTTDLAARGIDARNVNLVINVDVPFDPNTYLHRMGRAGRYGAHGIVISIVSDGIELKAFREMLGLIGGQSMSVSLIPKKGNFDLWTRNINSFKQITGVVPDKPIARRFVQRLPGERSQGGKRDSSSDSESSIKATVSVNSFKQKKKPSREPRKLISYGDLEMHCDNFDPSKDAPDNNYKIKHFLESLDKPEELTNGVCKIVDDFDSESNDGDSGNVDQSPDLPETTDKEELISKSDSTSYSECSNKGKRAPKLLTFSSLMDSLNAFKQNSESYETPDKEELNSKSDSASENETEKPKVQTFSSMRDSLKTFTETSLDLPEIPDKEELNSKSDSESDEYPNKEKINETNEPKLRTFSSMMDSLKDFRETPLDLPEIPDKEEKISKSDSESENEYPMKAEEPKIQTFSSMIDSLKAFTETRSDGKSKLETLEDRLQSALGYTDKCFQQLLDSDSDFEPSSHFVGSQNPKKNLVNDALCDFCVNNLPPDEIQQFSSLSDSLEVLDINQRESSPVFCPREPFRRGRNEFERRQSIQSTSSSDSSASEGVYFLNDHGSQIITVPMTTSTEKWYEMYRSQCQQINEYVKVCASYRN